MKKTLLIFLGLIAAITSGTLVLRGLSTLWLAGGSAASSSSSEEMMFSSESSSVSSASGSSLETSEPVTGRKTILIDSDSGSGQSESPQTGE
jgi:hypothetical protein